MIQLETILSVSYAFWQRLGVLQSASDRMFSWRCMAKKLIEHSERCVILKESGAKYRQRAI